MSYKDPKIQLIERYEGDFIISLDDFIMRDSSYFNKTGIIQTIENHNGYEGLELTDSFVDFLEERGYNEIVNMHQRGVPMGYILGKLHLTRVHALELKLILL